MEGEMREAQCKGNSKGTRNKIYATNLKKWEMEGEKQNPYEKNKETRDENKDTQKCKKKKEEERRMRWKG